MDERGGLNAENPLCPAGYFTPSMEDWRRLFEEFEYTDMTTGQISFDTPVFTGMLEKLNLTANLYRSHPITGAIEIVEQGASGWVDTPRSEIANGNITLTDLRSQSMYLRCFKEVKSL